MRLCDTSSWRSKQLRPLDVGPDIGSQRDPYRLHVNLCQPCSEALVSGDFARLHGRYSDTRQIERGDT